MTFTVTIPWWFVTGYLVVGVVVAARQFASDRHQIVWKNRLLLVLSTTLIIVILWPWALHELWQSHRAARRTVERMCEGRECE